MTPHIWAIAVELTGSSGSFVVRAAIDTGATVTLFPPEALLMIGCDPALVNKRVGITTASTKEFLPMIQVPEVYALGHRATNLEVVAHALPSSSSINGLLGMDFLLQLPDFQRLDEKLKKYFV